MRDGLQAGEDSGLVSVWEEVCIQIQGQRSVLWAAYEDTVYRVVYREVESLPPPSICALWLETDAGERWRCDQEDDTTSPPYVLDDVVLHVQQRVYDQAADRSNRRLRAYWRRHSV